MKHLGFTHDGHLIISDDLQVRKNPNGNEYKYLANHLMQQETIRDYPEERIPSHLQLQYRRHDGRLVGRPHGAYVTNRNTKKSYYLSAWSSLEKASIGMIKVLTKLLDNPSEQFTNFVNS